MSDVIGTAKAAKWTGFSEKRIRELCQLGRLEGAYQFAYGGKWLIPTATLERIRPRPPELSAETADVA